MISEQIYSFRFTMWKKRRCRECKWGGVLEWGNIRENFQWDLVGLKRTGKSQPSEWRRDGMNGPGARRIAGLTLMKRRRRKKRKAEGFSSSSANIYSYIYKDHPDHLKNDSPLSSCNTNKDIRKSFTWPNLTLLNASIVVTLFVKW